MQKSLSLFVANLDWGITSEDLAAIFSNPLDPKSGEKHNLKVVSANVVTDPHGRSKGFGFVDMATAEDAALAISLLNNTGHNGRNIVVREKEDRAERPPRRSREGFHNSKGW